MNNPIVRFAHIAQTRSTEEKPRMGVPEVQPDPTRFYVLTSTAAPSTSPAIADKPVRLLLRSVVVPEFLRGRVMQVRLAENEVKFVDEARWAEPLEAALNRVLRENFLQHGGVHVVGRGGESHDFEIAVQLRRFEGVSAAGVARIAARIEVYSGDVDATLVAQDDFTTDVPGWDGKDFGQLAGKLSVAAATLSERIFTLLPAKNS
jgi:uncharacterized lipoprotein YmbA